VTLRTRRRVVFAMVTAGVVGTGVLRAQPRRPRVGLLIAETVAGQTRRIDALLAGLRELGYVEGTSVTIEIRAANGAYDALPALAAELARSRVDVVVAFGIKALVAARGATATLPIVIPSTSSDPVAMGLVPQLARQDSNITGSLAIGPQIMAKRLELLKEVQPSLERAAVLVNPANAGFEPMAASMRATAAALGMALDRHSVRSPERLPGALDAVAKAGARALILQEDTMFAVHAGRIAHLALQRRLASVGNGAFAEAGGLLGYGASDLALYRRGAYFVDRILKGAKPGDLPIEQATRFELVANARTSRALGLPIPQGVLLRSDRVIE